jgi:hypothetical protein
MMLAGGMRRRRHHRWSAADRFFLFDFSITCACFCNTLGQDNTRAALPAS